MKMGRKLLARNELTKRLQNITEWFFKEVVKETETKIPRPPIIFETRTILYKENGETMVGFGSCCHYRPGVTDPCPWGDSLMETHIHCSLVKSLDEPVEEVLLEELFHYLDIDRIEDGYQWFNGSFFGPDYESSDRENR